MRTVSSWMEKYFLYVNLFLCFVIFEHEMLTDPDFPWFRIWSQVGSPKIPAKMIWSARHSFINLIRLNKKTCSTKYARKCCNSLVTVGSGNDPLGMNEGPPTQVLVSSSIHEQLHADQPGPFSRLWNFPADNSFLDSVDNSLVHFSRSLAHREMRPVEAGVVAPILALSAVERNWKLRGTRMGCWIEI